MVAQQLVAVLEFLREEMAYILILHQFVSESVLKDKIYKICKVYTYMRLTISTNINEMKTERNEWRNIKI